jgi:hypothetical protein
VKLQGADCKMQNIQMRDLCHPLNSCGAQELAGFSPCVDAINHRLVVKHANNPLLMHPTSWMPSTDRSVEPPFQIPASESSAGSELDMALCRLSWLHTPQVSAELLEVWTAERESTHQVF